LKTIKAEFEHIKSQKMLLAAILAIMFIPFLYSVFFLKSVWNPYGDAKYLPVAVVNEDRSVNFRGKKLDVGDQLVKNLKKNDTFFLDVLKNSQLLDKKDQNTIKNTIW